MSEEEKSNLLKEMEIWIDLYKFYFDLTLKANVIFYGIAGAVASFVLSHIGKETFRGLLFALLFPAVLGFILTSVSICGSFRFEPLQARFLVIMKDISTKAEDENERQTSPIHPDVWPLQGTLLLTGIVSGIVTVVLFCSPFMIPCLIK